MGRGRRSAAATTPSSRRRTSRRAGLRTLVLERRDRVGGAADTTELAPGIRVPTLAHTVGRLRPSVQRDLDLKRHGLSLVAPDVRVFAPGPDRRAIMLWDDVARTADGPACHLGRRRGRVPGVRPARPVARAVPRRARPVDPAGHQVARDRRRAHRPEAGPELPGPRRRATRGRSCASCRWRSRTSSRKSFESDALRAALAWRGVRYCAVGPWSAGTAAILLQDAAGNDGGAAGDTVFARGGPGALAAALAAAARAAGAEIRTGVGGHGDHVERRPRHRRRPRDPARRSRLAPSSRALDPKRTLVDLVDPVALGPSLGWRAGNIRTPGVVAKVNLALKRLPVFPAAGDDAERLLRGRIVVAPGIDAMERAFDASKYGRGERDADPRGDDPVARRPVPRRGREARRARHERDRAVRAVPAPARATGEAAPRRSATR